MYSLRVSSVGRTEDQEQFKLTVEILNGLEVTETRDFTYPLSLPLSEIQDELKKFLTDYNESKKAEQEASEATRQAEETIANLTGFELRIEEPVEAQPTGEADQTTETTTQEGQASEQPTIEGDNQPEVQSEQQNS